jgi:hypothetical protein
MKSCELYFRGSGIYAICQSVTEYGIGIATDPMVRLAADVPTRVLGEAVLVVLHASKEGVPHPGDLGLVTESLVRFTGFKSWASFAKNAMCLLVALNSGEIHVMPTARTRGGAFDHLPALTKKCRPCPDELGRLLLEMAGYSR